MQKSDIHILIIEDDPTLAKAIEEGLKRAGYSPTVATNYAQVQKSIKLNDFHGIVADCMIPQKSGVDIVLEIIEESPRELVVILISGIFKDRAFSHESQLKTRARAFLHKPFEIETLVSHFDESFAAVVDEVRSPLFQLLSLTQYSTQDKIAAINSTEYLHGFDLPFVYSLLMDNNIKGDLEIQYDEGFTTVIGFHSGRIDQVTHKDTESYFGVLLIEKGFVSAEELEAALKQKDNKPIGERLVDNSKLSPHAIEIIQMEQMNIRISKTIQDTSVKIHFTEQPTKEEPAVFINSTLFTEFLSDWICSKLSYDWLKTFYTPWLSQSVIQGPDFKKLGLFKNLSAVEHFSIVLDQSKWPIAFQDIISKAPKQEENNLRGLHFLFTQRVLVFDSREAQTEDFEIKIQRFRKIIQNTDGKNYFEILGLSSNSRPSEINRAYLELAKTLHPDKLSPDSPKELVDLNQKLFSRITEAYQVLNNEKRREEYKKTLELGQAEEVLKAEGLFEEGLRNLKHHQFRDARKCFEQVMKTKGHRRDALVHYLWALIKERRHKMVKIELAEKVKTRLDKIAHEDRHSKQYFFVKGMYYELIGSYEKSYKNFKHCLTLDPDFLDAKREATYLKQNYSKKKSKTLSSEIDFSTVLTKLFKRKSG